MTLLENLLKLQRKLNHQYRWTQGSEARNADGVPVWAYDRTARCWCLIGASKVVTETFGENRQLLGALQSRAYTRPDEWGEVFEMPLEDWNDDPERTFREVRELIARVIDAETARLQAVATAARARDETTGVDSLDFLD
jgi:hypothetical protein